MTVKQAGSSQATWALLTEGVASARVESHRLRAMISRALKLVAASEAKEHLYQVAGDLIQAIPSKMESIERHLDRTSYALSVLGSESLRSSLSQRDRKFVDDSVELSSPLWGPALHRSSSNVASRFLQKHADLNPPLGFPGGPCHTIDRIEDNIRNPDARERLKDEIEHGRDLSNSDAAKIYTLEVDSGVPGTRVRRIVISPHAQYRMDLRGVQVPALRLALAAFFKAYSDAKSQQSHMARVWEEAFARRDAINWQHKRTGLTVVFVLDGDGDTARIITAYWTNVPDDRPPGDGGCDL